MRKIFYVIFGLLILSCSPKVVPSIEYGNGNMMINVMNGKYSLAQFDSMCIADTLPRKLYKWEFLGLNDYETAVNTYLFSIVKGNRIYKVEDTMDDSVKIIKREIR